MKNFTPREIVAELNKYIIGQHNAKRAVAIALRNRWRRQNVSKDLKDEIAPKNIIMIAPPVLAKTEISRRLAHLSQSPFLKIEASKFTEVGYVGRDVESMVRDLTDLAINQVKAEEAEKVQLKAQEIAEERILDLLLPPLREKRAQSESPEKPLELVKNEQEEESTTRQKLRKLLRENKLNERMVELEITQRSVPWLKSSLLPVWRKWTSISRIFSATSFQKDPQAESKSSRSPGDCRPGRGTAAHRHGEGYQAGHRTGRAVRDYLSR